MPFVYCRGRLGTELFIGTSEQYVHEQYGQHPQITHVISSDIIADQDAAHPFELTGAEQEIRDHSSSCFVLGRSGTGCEQLPVSLFLPVKLHSCVNFKGKRRP